MFGRILSYQLVAFYQGKSNLVSGRHGITNFIFNKCDSFWVSMDTFKDEQGLEKSVVSCIAPWELWEGCGK
jgi:hypothetical protein